MSISAANGDEGEDWGDLFVVRSEGNDLPPPQPPTAPQCTNGRRTIRPPGQLAGRCLEAEPEVMCTANRGGELHC